MSILLLSDLKKSTCTIIRGKSKTPKTLPTLIIRRKKIVQFSKKRPSALIRGRTKLEKLRYIYINPFHATGIFLNPLKTSENQRFSDVLSGYRKRPVKNMKNMLILFHISPLSIYHRCPCITAVSP